MAVKVTVAEDSLLIDDEPRARSIISTVGENGVTTYMIDGSTSALRNRELRVRWSRLHRYSTNLETFSCRSLKAAMRMTDWRPKDWGYSTT